MGSQTKWCGEVPWQSCEWSLLGVKQVWCHQAFSSRWLKQQTFSRSFVSLFELFGLLTAAVFNMFQSFRHREAGKGAAKIGNFRCLFGVGDTSAVLSCWACMSILMVGWTRWNLEKGTAECNGSPLTLPMLQYEPGYLNYHAILWARLLRTGAEPLESLLNPSLRWSHEKELLLGWICHANVSGKYTNTSIPRRRQFQPSQGWQGM